jgi:beta-lactamase class A
MTKGREGGHLARGFDRRTLLAGASLMLATQGRAGVADPASLAALERQTGTRLGFALLDPATGKISGNRTSQRFALCSTFKLLLAGLVFQAAERGELKLDDLVPVGAADLVVHSPIVEQHVGGTLSIRALAEGTQKTSDNAAANLLMRLLGGPEGVTGRLRALGDKVTRIDRYEPQMNLVLGDDQRDTSTPEAMAMTVAKLLLGDLLSPSARAELAIWMADTKTGMRRLRAGAPPGWRIGDKTGTGYGPGRPNRVNDLAVLWPPHRAPLVVAAFLEAPGGFEGVRPEDEAVLASAMRLAVAPFLQT